jgi:hypothetical protein
MGLCGVCSYLDDTTYERANTEDALADIIYNKEKVGY